jgi:hypothetical protein
LKVQGVKLRVFEDQMGYFKTDGSSRGSCEIIPNYFFEEKGREKATKDLNSYLE